jgi:hypothetical protein
MVEQADLAAVRALTDRSKRHLKMALPVLLAVQNNPSRLPPGNRSFLFQKSLNMIQGNFLLKASKKTRRLRGQLTAAANDLLIWRYPYILPLKNLRIPVSILRGPTRPDGCPGTLLTAGAEHRIDYLSSRFFGGEYKRETLDRASLWNLTRTLERLQTLADMTIACLDRLSTRLFSGSHYLIVPEWVDSSLALPEHLNDLARGNYKLKRELQRVLRISPVYEVSRAEADFEKFYYNMHVPFTRRRYREQSIVHDFYQMRRVFQEGGLLLLKRNGQTVAGNLFQRRGQQLRSVAFGTVNGEWDPVESGAFAALYFSLIKHAKETGCKFVNFGASRPSISDGVLKYKRKWGGSLTDVYHNHYNFLVRWNGLNEPVASFLSSTPLIFRARGGFSAVCAIDRDERVTEAEADKIHRSMWMPGLHRLYLISTSGWQPGIISPPQTHLVNATIMVDSRNLCKSK